MTVLVAPELGVAVAQFAPGPDLAQNLATIRALATAAAARGAGLIVFPEYAMYFGGQLGAHCVAAAQPLDGPFVAALKGLAAELGVTVVAGMSERIEDEEQRFANTVVIVGPEGGIRGSYRKLHLYDAFGQRESDWIVPGPIAEPLVVEAAGVRVGVETCYDLRFPEVTRRLVDAGAELVLVPSQWVPGPLKEHHWRTLVLARAIENTVYLAAADHAPPSGAGCSLIVDPMGVELAALGETADAAVGWFSHERLVSVRKRNPSLALRRFRVEPRS